MWGFTGDLSAVLLVVMLCFLWLLVLYCAVGGQDLVGWTDQTNLMDSSWTNQTTLGRKERCEFKAHFANV
jgi:hypothetical protein